MIAHIRVVENGYGRHLCDLDLMKFSEEQVRERMVERGVSYDASFACGFVDWNVKEHYTLEQAYKFKQYIQELYDGDEYLIRYMLEHGKSYDEITKSYYSFLSKDEASLLKLIFQKMDKDTVVELIAMKKSVANIIFDYLQNGSVLSTPKGYYVRTGSV